MEGTTLARGLRRPLPDNCLGITHQFAIAGREGYLTVNLYEDGTPGEIFLVLARESSNVSGFADAFAKAVSICLQYGVPLSDLVASFKGMRFSPNGLTENPHIKQAESIVDYVCRWLELKYISKIAQPVTAASGRFFDPPPPCANCGSAMGRYSGGWKCPNCGNTSSTK
ncbi:MAG: hypothetical protein ACM3KM_03545 [Acidobacteriaceae bacterium]